MPETHKWKITVEENGVPKTFKNPNGGSGLDHIPFEGTMIEALLNIKKYMLNERKKRYKLERDLGESS